MTRLDELFTIEYGSHEINSKENLEEGHIPVISSQGTDNGCYGFFSVNPKYEAPIISLPRTGSVGEASVQLHPCDIDDNCLVLTPKQKLSTEFLFYITRILRNEKWRYKYGRQITPIRIGSLEVLDPENFVSDVSYDVVANEPEKKKKELMRKCNVFLDKYFDNNNLLSIYEYVPITDLFSVTNAKSKGFESYKKGKIPFVTNGFSNNGFVGFVDPNPKDRVFQNDSLCVSAFCETTVQKAPFLPRGNGGSGLVVLTPLKKMSFEELIFHASIINQNYAWRFSYGRMVTKNRINEFLTITKK